MMKFSDKTYIYVDGFVYLSLKTIIIQLTFCLCFFNLFCKSHSYGIKREKYETTCTTLSLYNCEFCL